MFGCTTTTATRCDEDSPVRCCCKAAGVILRRPWCKDRGCILGSEAGEQAGVSKSTNGTDKTSNLVIFFVLKPFKWWMVSVRFLWSVLSELDREGNIHSCGDDYKQNLWCKYEGNFQHAFLLSSPLFRSSAVRELWTVSALLCRKGVTVGRQGPPSQWGQGSAGDACTLAAIWPAGHGDDCYQSRKAMITFIFLFLMTSLCTPPLRFLWCISPHYVRFLRVHNLQEDVSDIPGANLWDGSRCWICPAHGLRPRWRQKIQVRHANRVRRGLGLFLICF